MRKFGLIGKKLTHSFSKEYFENKFRKENITDCTYNLFELPSIDLLPLLIRKEHLEGINVTIPYKEQVLPVIDKLDASATKVGAVNVIHIRDKIVGYNSDYYGFYKSLEIWNLSKNIKALVLGSGGASKAVVAVLKDMAIPHLVISRTKGDMSYESLRESELLIEYKFIINCTPLGMSPDIHTCPDIDYELVTPNYYFYDLVYNPELTEFLRKARLKGAHTMNGSAMLRLQAEKSWEIWNES